MCGLTGYWSNTKPERSVANQMAKQLSHRGPDSSGVWIDEEAGVALAHRRLSIIDISPTGHQPMRSHCGRYVLIYNGEIYNHLDIRSNLATERGSFAWRGNSDTETLLAALCHWGLNGALARVVGMFAFALWDSRDRKLYLARDRMGEKPLYYGICNNVFLFGSELKAIKAHPRWNGQLNRDALTLYLRHNYVPSPWSIYEGISKLAPGHYVTITDGGKKIHEPIQYWNLKSIATKGVTDASPQELTDELERLLRNAVSGQMIADVPLGAFLSGGIDSSTIAAIMQDQSTSPVKTFSIGFQDDDFNEAQHAKAVAAHLGTDHNELYIDSRNAMELIPHLPEIYDEPFSDVSQIPTFLICKMAKEHVTVSLSGDGGDELFCGYNRYNLALNIWQKLKWLPLPTRRLFAELVRIAPARLLDHLQQNLPNRMRMSRLQDRLPKLAEILKLTDSQALYCSLMSHSKDPSLLVRDADEPISVLTGSIGLPSQLELRQQMMLIDMLSYLPDDILTKVDRASMAASLEVRAPLLDHRIVEFAWRVPSKLKYHHGQSKWLLRQVLYRHVPRQLVDRPKMGFGVPIENWLRGPLVDWAEELLDEKKMREDGILESKPIQSMWKAFKDGKRGHHLQLWDLLMFQAWLLKEKDC